MSQFEAQALCDLIRDESNLQPSPHMLGNGEHVVIIYGFHLWSERDWHTHKYTWRKSLYDVVYA